MGVVTISTPEARAQNRPSRLDGIWVRAHIQLVGKTVISGGFEWDEDKAASNVAKHEISFEEAATVFSSDDTLETTDAVDASRVITVGFSAAARILLVVSTEVDEDRVRIISARRATASERRAFEEG
jgi:uncharacterized DUF497 family protein